MRYRAYISYAHADEAWAIWLQRALERYRVPSHLQASRSETLPRRLAPVFRDREDLSSSSDLNESLQQALRDSDALIVICSPAAAKSRWVNEEVRLFRALGRGDRIFCMVVEGDPGAGDDARQCFPPALSEGADSAVLEPLAADPRKFADGKQLAKLKLIAGLLGVRLDELRRRDHRRRRRWRLAAGLGAVAILALAAQAWLSTVAQRQVSERAEEMAGFIVGMGEELGPQTDLETRAKIGSNALAYLEQFDPRNLTAASQIGVARALRQIAMVNEEQGSEAEALEFFIRSRDLLAALHADEPDNRDAFFELGQAEFYIGYLHYNNGDYAQSEASFQRYVDICLALYELDSSNEAYLLEYSYAVTGALARSIRRGGPFDAAQLEQAEEAVDVAVRVLAAIPDNSAVLNNYAITLNWSADAQELDCRLDASLEQRRTGIEYSRRALKLDPRNNVLRESLAFRHSTLASVLEKTGRLDSAEQHYRQAVEMLEARWSEDSTNERLRHDLEVKSASLAELLIARGRWREAAGVMERFLPSAESALSNSDVSRQPLHDAVDLLLLRAALAEHSGQEEKATPLLRRARSMLGSLASDRALSPADRARWVGVEYELWHRGEALTAVEFPTAGTPGGQGGRLRSCSEAFADAQLGVIGNDSDRSAEAVAYLRSRGYADPKLRVFCARHPAPCSAASTATADAAAPVSDGSP